jgi:hypothetical protein
MKNGNQFLAIILVFWVSLTIACKNRNDRLNSEDSDPSRLSYSEDILSQRRSERTFSSSTPELIGEINFVNLEKPPYRPTYLRFDGEGALYTVDFSEFIVHKFSPSSDGSFEHSFFGKGRGQGPGELSRVLDFKIFEDLIYLADEGTGSIEVYANDGTYIRRIVLNNQLIPRRITLQEGRIIVGSLNPNGPSFFVYDLAGNMIFSFGQPIDKTSTENYVYQDNAISDSFSENCFYYLPRFLGFVGLYQGERLVMAKETVDGIRIGKKNIPIKKTIMKGVSAQTVSKKYETVLLHALHKDFILIKTYDYEKKKPFWDIYSLGDFDYRLSVKNPPISLEFAIHGNYLAVLTDTETYSGIRIYDMNKVIEETREQTGPGHARVQQGGENGKRRQQGPVRPEAEDPEGLRTT